MKVLGASAIAGALVTLEAFVSYAMAAKHAELPSPKRTGECVRYDNLPPVCGFRNVFLTDAQSKVILSYQHQNRGAFTNAAKSAVAAAPQIPFWLVIITARPLKPTAECVRYDHLPPVCRYKDVFLTDEQFKAVQEFHRRNVLTLQKAK